jgi:hypothetical protein
MLIGFEAGLWQFIVLLKREVVKTYVYSLNAKVAILNAWKYLEVFKKFFTCY